MADLYRIRPLGTWTDPVTVSRRSSAVFRATWDASLKLLRAEVDALDGQYPIVIQADITEADIRQDGMLRTRARVGPNPGVIVSFTSRHGPLRYATDAYEQAWSGTLPGWQANVRAIALALEALRAVDRYGVTKRGEQYAGWKAIAAPAPMFASAEAADRWMREYAFELGMTSDHLDVRGLYRAMARRMHPDTGAPRADWDRLNEAGRLVGVTR